MAELQLRAGTLATAAGVGATAEQDYADVAEAGTVWLDAIEAPDSGSSRADRYELRRLVHRHRTRALDDE